jgi:hypothetical protein
MRLTHLFTLAAALTLTGCHSAHIEATISNRTPEPLSLVELDYPSASFGTQTLAPNQDFHYRFKVLGSGAMKLLYTDNAHQDHRSDGPFLKEGADGPLTIIIADTGVTWQPSPTVAATR